jgi:hypothetical protein
VMLFPKFHRETDPDTLCAPFVEAVWRWSSEDSHTYGKRCRSVSSPSRASLWITPRIYCPQKSRFPPGSASISATRGHPVRKSVVGQFRGQSWVTLLIMPRGCPLMFVSVSGVIHLWKSELIDSM